MAASTIVATPIVPTTGLSWSQFIHAHAAVSTANGQPTIVWRPSQAADGSVQLNRANWLSQAAGGPDRYQPILAGRGQQAAMWLISEHCQRSRVPFELYRFAASRSFPAAIPDSDAVAAASGKIATVAVP